MRCHLPRQRCPACWTVQPSLQQRPWFLGPRARSLQHVGALLNQGPGPKRSAKGREARAWEASHGRKHVPRSQVMLFCLG